MIPDSSDITHGFGRMDSERQMRKPKWLDDVVSTAEGESDGVVADIEGRKKQMDEKHSTFLPTLETALGDDDDVVVENGDRKRQAQTLLTNADELLSLYHAANSSINKTFSDQNSLDAIKKNHEEDVQKLKNVMQVGKRICAGELEGIEQQTRAKELMGRSEVYEQAKGIFGGPRVGGGDASVERSLACVERGVRRMVKGLE